MRLFIAVNFGVKVKKRLAETIYALKKNLVKGNFSECDNLHVTLEFLGEMPESRTEIIKECMDAAADSEFDIKIGHLGRFKRPEGDIYWRHISADDELYELQSRLHILLKKCGFSLEKRQFKPHLTLGRKMRAPAEFCFERINAEIGEIRCNVNRISLMKSEHIGGKLKYTEIYGKELKSAAKRQGTGGHNGS